MNHSIIIYMLGWIMTVSYTHLDVYKRQVPGFAEYSENLIKSSTIEARKIDFGKESIAETREIPYNNAV